MPRLESKWASDENSITLNRPLEKKVSTSPVADKVASPPAAKKLASKWADAPDPEPVPNVSPKKNHTHLSTPPSSADASDKTIGKNFSRKIPHKSVDRGDHASHKHDFDRRRSSNDYSRSRSRENCAHSNHNKRQTISESGQSLASRLGDLKVKDQQNGKSGGHAGRDRQTLPRPREDRRSSIDSSESEEEQPNGVMTAAAKSFASRLDLPLNDPPKHRSDTQTSSHHKQSRMHKASHHEPMKSKQYSSALPASKYVTPKQKRSLEDQERSAKLAKEQELKEAKLKAEVQSMFEKMSDKTTSWADLEDE